jgi:hypothetical protein
LIIRGKLPAPSIERAFVAAPPKALSFSLGRQAGRDHFTQSIDSFRLDQGRRSIYAAFERWGCGQRPLRAWGGEMILPGRLSPPLSIRQPAVTVGYIGHLFAWRRRRHALLGVWLEAGLSQRRLSLFESPRALANPRGAVTRVRRPLAPPAGQRRRGVRGGDGAGVAPSLASPRGCE